MDSPKTMSADVLLDASQEGKLDSKDKQVSPVDYVSCSGSICTAVIDNPRAQLMLAELEEIQLRQELELEYKLRMLQAEHRKQLARLKFELSETDGNIQLPIMLGSKSNGQQPSNALPTKIHSESDLALLHADPVVPDATCNDHGFCTSQQDVMSTSEPAPSLHSHKFFGFAACGEHLPGVERSLVEVPENPCQPKDGLDCFAEISLSTTSSGAEQPIILPKPHAVTDFIVSHDRVQKKHGVFALLPVIRDRYWIIEYRVAGVRTLGPCIVRRRFSAHSCQRSVTPSQAGMWDPGGYPFNVGSCIKPWRKSTRSENQNMYLFDQV